MDTFFGKEILPEDRPWIHGYRIGQDIPEDRLAYYTGDSPL